MPKHKDTKQAKRKPVKKKASKKKRSAGRAAGMEYDFTPNR